MNTQVKILLGINIALLIGLGAVFKNSDVPKDASALTESIINVKPLASDVKLSFKNLKASKNSQVKRRERLSARFFLPIPGERNALSDMVDGIVIQRINKNVPIAKSYRALLKEEDPEMSKDDLKEKVDKFKRIVSAYLQEMYKIQRGIGEGDILSELAQLKMNLSTDLAIDVSRLSRLVEIEKKTKSARQLKTFEKLLVRDNDRLSDEQKKKAEEILMSKQRTIFSEPATINDHFQMSDDLLENIRTCLNEDQAEHFKYFQEYHWHSTDMPEVNDLPGMF
ncbi:MAG: hypothetical protein NE330_04435 [Lentisphaeraceae bacterium]|nr:hypothetical protein [Lentisphaeraceae bacterium]